MNLTVTYVTGTGAGSGRVRVGHNSSAQNPDAVWSFTTTLISKELSFTFTWDNTAAGTGWKGAYDYVFALSTVGTADKQLAKGNNNIDKVVQKLSGSAGSVTVKFEKQLQPGTYYIRANFNGSTLSTMKAFSTTATGTYEGYKDDKAEDDLNFYGVPAKRIYLEKSIKKADDDTTVDRLVMVGYNGMMLSSTDGGTWTALTTGTSSAIYGVNYIGGVFIAVGDNGLVLISSDSGATWTSQNLSTAAFESAAYNDGLYLVAGGGEIWVTNDLTNWERVVYITPDWNHFEGIIWDGEKYIAYGLNTNYISNDGYSWDSHTGDFDFKFVKMIKSQGRIYAIQAITGSIYRSADGLMWEEVKQGPGSNGIITITYGNGRLLAVGKNGLVTYSDDGINWTDRTYQSSYTWDAVGYGFGRFIVGGRSESTYSRAWSTDGISWYGFNSVDNSPTDVEFGLSKYHNDIKQACLMEILKRQAVNKVEGEVENTLPPKYGVDYNLGDIVEINAAGYQGRQRITKVRHVLEPSRVSITPVIGDDFLDLRQFIAREVNK